MVFDSGGSVGRRLVGKGTSVSGGGGCCGLDEFVGSGLDPESGMRVVSSVTPWGSAAAIVCVPCGGRVGGLVWVLSHFV